MTELPKQRPKDIYYLIISCLFVYAASIFTRLSVVTLTSQESLIGVTTPDAYGWLAAIQNTGILRDHVLAHIARFVLETKIIDLTTFALYSPIVIGSLTAPLLVCWGYYNKNLSCGIFAGLIGTQLPAFYARTSFGYFDSDAVVAPLLVLVIFTFQIWHAFVTRSALNERISRYRVFLYTVVVSLLLFFSHRIHISFIFNSVLLVLVSAILNRRSIPHLVYIILISIFGYIGMGLSAVIFALSPHWHWISPNLKHTGIVTRYKYFVGAFGIVVLLILIIGGLLPEFGLTGRIQYYIGGPVHNILQTFADEPRISSIVVHELEQKSLTELLQVATGNVFLSLLGLSTIPYLLLRNRNSLFFLFPVLVGLSSPLLGIRFTLFLTVPLAISVAFFISSITENLIKKESNRFLVVVSLAAFYWYQLFDIYEHNPPRVFGSAQVNAALIKLGRKISHPCDVALISWQYGYAANFYANLPTVLDGGTRTVGGISAYSKMLLTSEPSNKLLSAQVPNILAHKQFSFRQESQSFGCRLESIRSNDLHVVITWDDILNLYWPIYYSNQLDRFRDLFIVLGEAEKLDKDNGRVLVDDTSLKLATVDFVNDEQITTKRFAHDSSWHLVYNESTNAGIVVDSSLYRTFILDVFLSRFEVEDYEYRYRDSSAVIISMPFRNVGVPLAAGKSVSD